MKVNTFLGFYCFLMMNLFKLFNRENDVTFLPIGGGKGEY